MARVDLVMPKMGESIMEATIIRWVKNVGDVVEADETVLEIATDKVDSEVPAVAGGTLVEVRFKENDVVPVGEVIAVIDTAAVSSAPAPAAPVPAATPAPQPPVAAPVAEPIMATPEHTLAAAVLEQPAQGRFYSPLVLNIAREEGIGMAELDRIPGTGGEGRVTKRDILVYLESRISGAPTAPPVATPTPANELAAVRLEFKPPVQEPPVPRVEIATPKPPQPAPAAEVALVAKPDTKPHTATGPEVGGLKPKSFTINGEYEILEMDRMRRLIAENMVYSKHVSPHVTSFVEADVTNIVQWREKHKTAFESKYGEKITFTPIFLMAVAKALRDFPLVNIAVDGDKILKRKDINLGMAAALPSGNLIVPVIRNADRLNLPGLTKAVNDLTARARAGKLGPDDIADGTYTVSNVGTFGNVMGTPIILQPQCAVLAVGAIQKKPAVLETPMGDVIAVRHRMFLSHSYDHRVIDGALGGSFVRRVADYLEAWDANEAV
ncbi:MAG: dihydrolipoamide acetyltransferase family protein [Bacteroidia bacterium]|nr:dihydrolipoamide acetyltransferase family protein [Bacteroidia bacterium]